MSIIIFCIGLIAGMVINITAHKLGNKITADREEKNINLLNEEAPTRAKVAEVIVALICGFLFLIGFLRFGINIIFIKFILLSFISIIVSLIDFKHQIIPDSIVILTFILSVLTISIFAFDVSFTDTVLGMLVGGGLLFILALIPGAMGGGDVKFMFALGSFLGLNITLWALLLAFVLASCISIMLLLFKVKGRKEHIPFGPFLSVGSLIAFYMFA
jgi:leader peptidase (prepilin peptidase) / N-methyltransferase